MVQRLRKFLGKLLFVLCLPALAVAAPKAGPKNVLPPELEGIGITPNLGAQISLATKFRDESGAEVSLQKYFDGKRPVAVIMAYYGCPMLCGFLLNAAREAFEKSNWKMGEQFDVVTISIDPREEPELAKAKKDSILKAWSGEARTKEGATAAWHFLVGKKEDSELIARELGFKYRWEPETEQYAHGPGIFFLSPQGKLTRVLFGIDYQPKDLKLALLEASEGKVGNIAEKILGLCYSYDPKADKYALFATRLMKAGGGVTVLIIVLAYMALFFRRRSPKVKG